MVARKLGVVCGGSGSSKFVRAFEDFLFPNISFDPVYIANVADNFWHYGLYVCPDVDILTYTLAHRLDEQKGWGIKKDTLNFKNSYALLNPREAWFNLGDKDLAICLRRTELIRESWKLSKITDYFRRAFGIKEKIVPATDDPVQTFISTGKNATMHLQRFWVQNHGSPRVRKVSYRGLENAQPHTDVFSAFMGGGALILPANPISSILPTIKLRGVERELARRRLVVAISPFIGNRVFSGPAAKFMRAAGEEPSAFGVAKLYSSFVKIFLVDSKEEQSTVRKIQDLGMECIRANILIRTSRDRKELAAELAELF